MTPQSSTATGGDPMVGIVEVPLRRKPGAPPCLVHGPLGAPTSTFYADDGTVTVTRFTDEPWYRRPHAGTPPVDEPIGRTIVDVLHGCLAVAEARAERSPYRMTRTPHQPKEAPVTLARWAARLALRCLHALFDGASPTREPR